MQHLEAELLLFENYSFFIHVVIQKIGHILKNKQKNKCVRIHTINHDENEDENEK